jgi:hypothetical protein
MREVRLIEEKCNVLCRRRFVHPLQLLWDIAVKSWLTPVMLPPGRFKLATIPASTGSTPRGNIIISVMTKSDQSRAGACPLANNGCTASAWATLSDLGFISGIAYGSSVGENSVGAPRPMKMGTTRSPFPYDTTAQHTSKSAKLRHPTTLHYAP